MNERKPKQQTKERLNETERERERERAIERERERKTRYLKEIMQMEPELNTSHK